MYDFTDDWAAEIAEISTQPEFQNATIRIVYSEGANAGNFTWATGLWDGVTPDTVYEGQARIIGVRWGSFSGGEGQANSQTISAIRIQLPYNAAGRVRRGCKVFVTDGGRNPVLEQFIFAVTSDLQGSSSAARTLECSLDSDVALATV